jgi:hypothetical protein
LFTINTLIKHIKSMAIHYTIDDDVRTKHSDLKFGKNEYQSFIIELAKTEEGEVFVRYSFYVESQLHR